MKAYEFYAQYNIYGIKFHYDIINNKKSNIRLPKHYHNWKKLEIENWNDNPFYYNYYLNQKVKTNSDCPLCFTVQNTNIVIIDTDNTQQSARLLSHPLVKNSPYLETRQGIHLPILITDYSHYKDVWDQSLIGYHNKLDIIRNQVFETEQREVLNSHASILALSTSTIMELLGKPSRDFNFDTYSYIKGVNRIKNIQYTLFVFLIIIYFVIT